MADIVLGVFRPWANDDVWFWLWVVATWFWHVGDLARLVLWLVPDSLTAQAVAFGLFRFFDTVKPPPIRQADRHFKGGFGVMFDDLLAAGYTLLIMAVLVRVGIPF